MACGVVVAITGSGAHTRIFAQGGANSKAMSGNIATAEEVSFVLTLDANQMQTKIELEMLSYTKFRFEPTEIEMKYIHCTHAPVRSQVHLDVHGYSIIHAKQP